MNALDLPLEAGALNYLSFGFLTGANSVWTLVAVITAAVSVWRIRASSPRGRCLDESSLLTCFPSSPPVERLTVEPSSTTAEPEVASPSTRSVSVFEREGRTSGKFTVYYQKDDLYGEDNGCINAEDESEVVDDDNEEDEIHRAAEKVVVVILGNDWEVTMKMRMADFGWYRHQNLTVLDGSVVRLWDGCRRWNAISSRLIACGGDEGVIPW